MDINDLLDELYGSDKDKISIESFDILIKNLNMKPDYQIILDHDGDIIINEEWSSLISSGIKANRIYKFDINYLDMISFDDRFKVLSEILEIYVNQEKYENAACIRDTINQLN